MLKKQLLKYVAVFCLVLIALPVGAEDGNAGGFYFAPEVAYVLPTDGDVDDSVFAGARLGYGLGSNLALELESGWTEVGIDTDRTESLDIEMIPVMANLRYNFDRSDWGYVYTFGGVGASINHLEDDLGGDIEIDDSVAWQVGLGAAIPLSDSMEGFIDIRYFYNEPDLNNEGLIADALLPKDANLESVWFNLGVQF